MVNTLRRISFDGISGSPRHVRDVPDWRLELPAYSTSRLKGLWGERDKCPGTPGSGAELQRGAGRCVNSQEEGMASAIHVFLFNL